MSTPPDQPGCADGRPARLRQADPARPCCPFLVARVVVLGALGLAHFIVDRTHPSTAGVAARVHEGCSAGMPATTRRSPGWATTPLGDAGAPLLPRRPRS